MCAPPLPRNIYSWYPNGYPKHDFLLFLPFSAPWDMVLQCSFGCLGTHYVEQTGLEFTENQRPLHSAWLQELFQLRLCPKSHMTNKPQVVPYLFPFQCWIIGVCHYAYFVLFLKWALGIKLWFSFLYSKHFTASVVSTTLFLKLIYFWHRVCSVVQAVLEFTI